MMEADKSPGKYKTPVYEYSLQEATRRGELGQFYTSWDLNVACAKAISSALSKHYNHFSQCLDAAAAAREVVGSFGFDRTMRVLANTVRFLDDDRSLSHASREWACTSPALPEKSVDRQTLVNSNPNLIDRFVDQVRHDYLLTQPLKAADIQAEAARILKGFQAALEPNSPSGTHFMVQLSPTFLARANTKDHDRLINMLPFASLSLSPLNNRKGIFALILAGEDRNQPLRSCKPSIKTQLTETKTAQVEKPTAQRNQEVR